MDKLDLKKIDFILWLENELNKDKIFDIYEMLSFQLMVINLFYHIEATLERKMKPLGDNHGIS